MGKRFNKANVLAMLRERMDYIEKVHGFRWGDGRVEVENKSHDLAIEFGAYEELRNLVEIIEDGAL
jgi:hypothetical protein